MLEKITDWFFNFKNTHKLKNEQIVIIILLILFPIFLKFELNFSLGLTIIFSLIVATFFVKHFCDRSNDWESDIDYKKALNINELNLWLGNNLIEENENIFTPIKLIQRIEASRNNIYAKLGYSFTQIHIRDKKELPLNDYEICINEYQIKKGIAYPNKVMIQEEDWARIKNSISNNNYVMVLNVQSGKPVYWVEKEELEPIIDIQYKTAQDIIIEEIEKIVFDYIDELLSVSTVDKYIEEASMILHPSLIENLLPKKLSLIKFKKILTNLIKEDISIKNVELIFETLNEYIDLTNDPNELTEKIKNHVKNIKNRN